MRDPNRLDELYRYLLLVHKNHFPDWRFGQFMCNLERWYGKDIFYTEDSMFYSLVTKFVEEIERNAKKNAN